MVCVMNTVYRKEIESLITWCTIQWNRRNIRPTSKCERKEEKKNIFIETFNFNFFFFLYKKQGNQSNISIFRCLIVSPIPTFHRVISHTTFHNKIKKKQFIVFIKKKNIFFWILTRWSILEKKIKNVKAIVVNSLYLLLIKIHFFNYRCFNHKKKNRVKKNRAKKKSDQQRIAHPGIPSQFEENI